VLYSLFGFVGVLCLILTSCKVFFRIQLVRMKEKPQIRPICNLNMQLEISEYLLASIVWGLSGFLQEKSFQYRF
jgi:hypothetical protein